MVHDSLVCQLSDSTEAIIQRMTEGIQKLIKVCNTQGDEEEKEEESSIKINPAKKEHWELEIKILRDSPRDADKLREILKVKQEEYGEAEPKLETYKGYLQRSKSSSLYCAW
jgi:hypothetical protein